LKQNFKIMKTIKENNQVKRLRKLKLMHSHNPVKLKSIELQIKNLSNGN
jgi:hypothetical protein